MSDFDIGGVIDEYTGEDEQQLGVGLSFPTIQWINGDAKLKPIGLKVPYTGGWFIPSEGVERLNLTDQDMTKSGWERGEATFGGGITKQGWFIRDLTVAIICWRRAWELHIGQFPRYLPWNGGYSKAETLVARAAQSGVKDPYFTSRLRVLCAVKGWPIDALVNLTMHGTVQRAFFNLLSGPVTKFVLQPARAMSSKGRGASVPMRIFWLTFGPERDAKGLPVFTTVGEKNRSATITAPTLVGITDKADKQMLAKMFIDEDHKLFPNRTYLDSVFNDPSIIAWRQEWDVERTVERPDEDEDALAPEDEEPTEIPF